MAARYWVGGTATRDATAGVKRSTTSGGVGGAAVPGAGDDVFFDANSGSVTVTKGTTTTHISVNFTGFTGTFAGTTGLTVTSNITFGSGMTRTWTGSLGFTGTCTINTNGITTASAITLNSGSLTLQDNWNNSNGSFILTAGTLSLNSYNFTFGIMSAGTTNIRTINLGTGIIECTSSGTVRSVNTTNLTLNSGTSLIKLTNVSGVSKGFSGGGLTYYDFWNATGGTGFVSITGSNTWNTIKINAGRDQRFGSSIIHYMKNLDAIGTGISPINIDSPTSFAHQLSKIGGGTIQVEYCVIQRSEAQQTNTRYANNSTDNGSNLRWIFGPAPVTGQISKVFFM